jgi:DNA-binding transcriptional MerR regulator
VPDPLPEIPDRAAFKAAEVCEIAQIPPYVLRSWEKEFPGLGVAGKPGGPKVYRRSDVEQVLRIKQLLFSEGLTLSGARRKLEGEPPPEAEGEATLPVPEEVRTKVATVRRELRSLLDMLSTGPGTDPTVRQPAGAAAREGPEEPPAAPARVEESAAAVQVRAPGGAADASGSSVTTPATAATSPPSPARPTDMEETSLPLLNGTPETPSARARTRRSRRPAKG